MLNRTFQPDAATIQMLCGRATDAARTDT